MKINQEKTLSAKHSLIFNPRAHIIRPPSNIPPHEMIMIFFMFKNAWTKSLVNPSYAKNWAIVSFYKDWIHALGPKFGPKYQAQKD